MTTTQDEHLIEVVVEQVFDNGTTAIGIGRDTLTGELIRFAGDWRPMAELAQAVALDEEALAVIEPWQVLSRS